MALIVLQSFFFQPESKHAVAAGGTCSPVNAAQQRSTGSEQIPAPRRTETRVEWCGWVDKDTNPKLKIASYAVIVVNCHDSAAARDSLSRLGAAGGASTACGGFALNTATTFDVL